jgi:mitochondrial fission protein ELM1
LLDWLPAGWVFADLPKPPFPRVVIGTGARGSRALRWIKKQDPAVFAVQVMRPAGGWTGFDVVVVPAHDNPPRDADNVCVTVGAANRVTAARLQNERQRWEKRLAHCPAPRLAVLVGGDSRHAPFGVEEAKRLARDVLAAARAEGLSLLVSTSRRSGEAVTAALKRLLAGQKEVPVHFWEPGDVTQRDNPFFAYLATAQAVVVTGDSVSMISEAATSGKPVYVWAKDGEKSLASKFRAFFKTMEKQGRARLWSGKLTMRAPASALMDNALVAGFIRARLMRRK